MKVLSKCLNFTKPPLPLKISVCASAVVYSSIDDKAKILNSSNLAILAKDTLTIELFFKMVRCELEMQRKVL